MLYNNKAPSLNRDIVENEFLIANEYMKYDIFELRRKI